MHNCIVTHVADGQEEAAEEKLKHDEAEELEYKEEEEGEYRRYNW